jgi:hypothetical protein
VLFGLCPQYSSSATATATAAAAANADDPDAVAARHARHNRMFTGLNRCYSSLKIELYQAGIVGDCKDVETVLDEAAAAAAAAAQPAAKTAEQLELEAALQALLQLLHIALPNAIPAEATVMDGSVLGSALAAAEPEFFDEPLGALLADAATLVARVTDQYTGTAAATTATGADADDEQATAAVELQRTECLRVHKCLHACCTQLRAELTHAHIITVATAHTVPAQHHEGPQNISLAQKKLVSRFLVAASEAAHREPAWCADSDNEEYDFAPVSIVTSARRRAVKQYTARELAEKKDEQTERIDAHYTFYARLGRASILGNRIKGQ